MIDIGSCCGAGDLVARGSNRKWFSAIELIDALGLAKSTRELAQRAKSEGWKTRKVTAGVEQYHLDSLPAEMRSLLLLGISANQECIQAVSDMLRAQSRLAALSEPLWEVFIASQAYLIRDRLSEHFLSIEGQGKSG